MTFIREFITARDPDTGYFGWVPLGFAVANATDGLGLAHDLLEHVDLSRDPLAGELMAVGASWYLRYESRWRPSLRLRYARGLEERDMIANIASCFIEALRAESHRQARSWPIAWPGAVAPIEWADEEIAAAVAASIKDAIAEAAESDEDVEDLRHDFLGQKVEERAAGWVRLGYRIASRRYRHFGPSAWSSVFNRLSDEAEIMLKAAHETPGLRLRARVHTRRGLIRLNGDLALDGPIDIAPH